MDPIQAKVYEILTKKRFCRDAPSRRPQLQGIIALAIRKGHPIPLVGFWGIGGKTRTSESDEACCEFLCSLRSQVQAVYPPGIRFMFIFATQHAVFNGYREDSIASYMGSVKSLFGKYVFEWVSLDGLWQKYGITLKLVDSIVASRPKAWWSRVRNHELLEKSASKRSKKKDSKEAAMRYYIFRRLESPMLQTEFKGWVFHTFSEAQLKNVLPSMPTLYLYATGKGRSESPWFIE